MLYGAYARGRQIWASSQQERDEADMMIKLIELGWGKESPEFRQVFTMQFIPGGSPDHTRWFNDLERISASPATAARLLRGFHVVDVREVARQVSCPTLVLHSREDRRVPFEKGRLLAALVPGARFVPLESRNHILLESEPAWGEFIANLRAFLPEAAPTIEAGSLHGMLAELTARELELLELIAEGLDNREIAERLFLSDKTVRNHVTSLFAKLDVQTRAQAIVRARDAGLGQPGTAR